MEHEQENMSELLEHDATNTLDTGHLEAGAEPPPIGETRDERENRSGLSTRTGYPNPLKLDLTACHLPAEFVKSKRILHDYVSQHLMLRDIQNISPSTGEQQLYEKYKKMPSGGIVNPRLFAAAVRLIAGGRPLVPEQKRSINDMAL
jgi:hypothetical protein